MAESFTQNSEKASSAEIGADKNTQQGNKMPNPSYLAGVRLEREIVNLLKKHLNPKRYTIIRTAGSHSPVDVVVLKHIENKGRIREYFGIQCKTKKKKSC